MPVDLLAFGPHPDDIEIGLGGTIARHTAEGRTVGLCDLTAGELGSNGTPRSALAGSRGRRASVLGAAWRENLGWPDGGISRRPRSSRDAVESDSHSTSRGRSRCPTGTIAIPDHVAAARVLTIAAFRSGLRRFDTGVAPWRADWVCYYFINDAAPRVVRRRRVGALRHASGRRSTATRVSSRRPRRGRGRHATHGADVPAADRNAATRSSARAPASRSPRASSFAIRSCAHGLLKGRPMKIGIVCYASVGGSGVVATELALALAGRGHEVRLISSELPFRWRDGIPNLHFERVQTPAYPLFREPQYLLALASTIVRVACDHQLDIVHAHYAVPHATAAYLGEQILSREIGGDRCAR